MGIKRAFSEIASEDKMSDDARTEMSADEANTITSSKKRKLEETLKEDQVDDV